MSRTGSRAPSIANNPFHTPSNLSLVEKHSSITTGQDTPRQRFKSQRLIGKYQKSWLEEKDPREKFPNLIFAAFMVLALGLGVLLVYFQWTVFPNHDYCLAFEDNFQSLNSADWNHDIRIDGYNAQSFDWTTNDERNSYIDSEGLHIVPTLTTSDTNITTAQLYDGYTLNMTANGCQSTPSFHQNNSCVIFSNYTSGATLPPVRSARLTTQGKHTIKYGRVEVVAKMVKGDWLYPAISLYPDTSVYGIWPRSGEINIASFRANGAEKYSSSGVGGIDTLRSMLHWGPSSLTDQYKGSTGKHPVRRAEYSDKYYTYGVEWSPGYIFTYVNSRLIQVFTTKYPKKTNLWTRGSFAAWTQIVYGFVLDDPWSQTGNPNTPFDQPFYLDLTVSAGARNGFFPDNKVNKPWSDSTSTAVRDFALANTTWYQTWDKSGLTVKSVKMWSLGKCA